VGEGVLGKSFIDSQLANSESEAPRYERIERFAARPRRNLLLLGRLLLSHPPTVNER